MLRVHGSEPHIGLTCTHRLICRRCLSVLFVGGIGVHVCITGTMLVDVIVAPPYDIVTKRIHSADTSAERR